MPAHQIDGYSFDYVEQGAGEPVVLVHGSVSDRRTWARPLATLSEGHRVIAYSRRYHWPNTPIAEGADYSMVEHVDDLEAWLPALDAAPAHLVGHSYGGYVCLLLAIRRPDLVKSLVLMEPPVLRLFTSDPPKPHELLRALITRPRTGLAILKLGATGLGPATAAFKRGDIDKGVHIFGRAVLGPEAFEAMSEERMQQVHDNTIAAEFLGSGFAPLVADEVRAVKAPTLLVTGEKSPAIFHRFIERLAELLPDNKRAEVPNASHNIHEDNAEAFETAVLSFLRKHA